MTDQIDPVDPAVAEAIRASFARQPMMSTFGAELTGIARGTVEVTAGIGGGALQQHGVAHAGLTFALGDTAAGYSALSCLSPRDEVMTSEMKIHLLAPGRGESLRAVGRVIRAGRRLVVVAADVYARDQGRETLIATLLGTIVPLRGSA